MLFHNMRRLACRAVALLLIFSGSVEGHLPEGKIFPAFPFPPGATPLVNGDLSDWIGIDETFGIDSSDLVDVVANADVDESDFSVRMWVGWSDTENRLYIAARVLDDIHQIDRPAGAAILMFQDDAMEVFIDADHSGGQFADFPDLSAAELFRRNGTEASHFAMAGPPPDDDFFVNYSAAGWYSLDDGPFTAAAYSFQADVGGLTAIDYEMMLVPYDRIDVGAEFQSIRHDLEAGEVLGFNVRFSDFDHDSVAYDATLVAVRRDKRFHIIRTFLGFAASRRQPKHNSRA